MSGFGILDELNLYTYDFEVTKFDWLFVAKRFAPDDEAEYTIIHNDGAWLRDWMRIAEPVLAGFNNKHYDKYILRAILAGRSPSEVKEVNDWIIGGNDGWKHPYIKNSRTDIQVQQFDIRDDMQDNISLKSIEAQLYSNIEETEVDFDIDREWTDDELAQMIHYCKADVDATEQVIMLRKDYLQAKSDLGRMIGLEDSYALSMTNATLVSNFLDASETEHHDERMILYPDTVDWKYIQPEVKAFFDRAFDPKVEDGEVFTGNCEFSIGNCPVTVGWGGIHAAIPTYHEKATEERVIRNWDVASLYPSLMIQYNLCSRCMDTPETFRDVYNKRIEAKHSGDKKTANTLKLVLNTTYGTMLLPGGQMYDPRMGHSVCVSGQLLILMLANMLVEMFPSLYIIQLNTDGIMVSCEKKDLKDIHKVIDDYQAKVRLVLEEDEIDEIWEKDVNNYVMRFCDGHTKAKGAYFKEGVSLVGAFSVNNDFNIVKKAVYEYFVNGIDADKTVNDCNDIRQFQLIARGGSKYTHVTHEVNGEEIRVQKCNRVYAAKDKSLGILYKYSKATGKPAKIANCPPHCIIDNTGNGVTIDQIDKQFYIDMAKKRISDFFPKQKKGKKQMEVKEMPIEEVKPVTEESLQDVQDEVTYKNAMVYRKLAIARRRLIESGIKPSGKNQHMKFQYFELKDFVPQVTRIFEDIGLVSIFNIIRRDEGEIACLTIVDTDDTNSEDICFFLPFVRGAMNNGVQEVQALGSGITYARRYLYQMALDLCESDEVDGESVLESIEKPVTRELVKREEAKEMLTAPVSNNADSNDIEELKAALLALRERTDDDTYIQQVALETKGLTSFTKEQKEAYMIEIANRISEVEG